MSFGQYPDVPLVDVRELKLSCISARTLADLRDHLINSKNMRYSREAYPHRGLSIGGKRTGQQHSHRSQHCWSLTPFFLEVVRNKAAVYVGWR
jgi:hypothetical protein